MELSEKFRNAIQSYWAARDAQGKKQIATGVADRGTRSAVTGGYQMNGLIQLVSGLLMETGLEQKQIHTKKSLELPGYYRPEKKWDLVAIKDNQLICAIEFKSQVGPSF